MITKWSEQKIIKDLGYVKDGENLFVDKKVKLATMNLPNQLI